MADVKIGDLGSLGATPATNDVVPIVDVSDTTMAASGTTKKVTRANLVGGLAASGANSDITSLTGLTTPLAGDYGGTESAYTKFTGPATSKKTFTLPNASATILTDNAAVSVAQGGTGSGTASGARTNLGVAIGSDVQAYSANILLDAIEFVIDGGGSAITTGMKGFLEIPFACTINRATLLADQSGSIVVDVFKCTYSAFDVSTHPVSGDKITASAPPTISTAVKAQDATLTGWTTSISAGDILAFNVNSATTITRVTLSLKITKT